MILTRVCALLLWWATSATAATYYIDATGGADTNNGTAKGTAWAHAPGMANCTNTCASTTPAAGDNFIFKGGESWGNASLKWTWSWSGSSGSRIYLGVDQTWYTGGSWSRPILTAGGSEASADNLFFALAGDYVTFDHFEMTGARFATGYVYGGNAFINVGTSLAPLITNLYIHGWSNADTSDGGSGIMSTTTLPSSNTGMEIAYNIIDGSDTAEVLADPTCTGACEGSMVAIWYGPLVHHNVMRYVSNGYIGAADHFYNNLIEYTRRSISAPVIHENAFLNNTDPCTGLYFYNNLIRHTVPGVTIWISPQSGCSPTYAFNNVVYDVTDGNDVFTAGYALTNPGGTAYFLNNTVECGLDSNPARPCMRCGDAGNVCHFTSNHFIGDRVEGAITSIGTLTENNNVYQTKAAAATDGYAMATHFAPTSAGGDSIGAGVNSSASCSGDLAALCTDTTFGVLVGDPHTIGRTGIGRFAPWDSGAYQYREPNGSIRGSKGLGLF